MPIHKTDWIFWDGGSLPPPSETLPPDNVTWAIGVILRFFHNQKFCYIVPLLYCWLLIVPIILLMLVWDQMKKMPGPLFQKENRIRWKRWISEWIDFAVWSLNSLHRCWSGAGFPPLASQHSNLYWLVRKGWMGFPFLPASWRLLPATQWVLLPGRWILLQAEIIIAIMVMKHAKNHKICIY